ncbi:hypothetical protein GGH94_004004 [Coemansia aciculifera]|uniref:Ion transport domain-containing protein n=1 Tax=Coemansia aciculifera TaxID=417176 RepID=A0A9W8M2L3_9FUNG|nr:hypothetical protein GGH94_004004 [Coemansia aciculifera]
MARSNHLGGVRKSSDSLGFEEATFVTSPTLQARNSQSHSRSVPPKQMTNTNPLHTPRFPIPVEHRSRSTAVAGASGLGHSALAIEPLSDAAAIELNMPGRAGPLRSLPTGLFANSGDLAEGTSSGATAGNRGEDVEKLTGDPATIKSTAAAAAAAAAAVVTPPAVDEERWYQEQIDYVRTQVEQMEHVDVQRGQEAKSIRSKWRRELFLLFEDPSSSPSAFIINVFVTFMIIFSAILTTIETIPQLRKGNSHMWFALELVIVAIFTLEFVLRFLGHTDTWRQAWSHAKSVVTIVDALAIFPFYIELVLHRDTSYEFRFTILRIFRLLRVFSAFKYSSLLQLSIEVMIVAIKRSADALLAFLLFVALTVVLSSTLMYFAERGTWNEDRQAFLTSDGEYSKFSSIPAAAYYSIVTLTTTGFGDMVPTTFFGKLVSFPMMLSGILLIALPSIIVGRNFTHVWEAARRFRVRQSPNIRTQRIGQSLIQEEVSDARSSARTTSRRSRRRHQKLRHRSGAQNVDGKRRDDSVSSFESRSTRATTRSPREIAGGYTNVYSGTINTGDTDYARRADPIDALARKDSFEMQELASTPQGLQELRPDGYAHVTGAVYDDAGEDARRIANNASSTDDDYDDETGPVGLALKRVQVQRKRGSKGKEKDLGHAAGDTVRVQRVEWEALNAELVALRSVLGSNGQALEIKVVAEADWLALIYGSSETLAIYADLTWLILTVADVPNAFSRFYIFKHSSIMRMNKIRIGAVTDLDRTFVVENVGVRIEQQMYSVLEASTMLKLDGDTTNFRMFIAICTASSTAILQHLELANFKCTTDDIIQLVAALPSLVSPTCEVRGTVASIAAIPTSENPASLQAKYNPLSSNFKKLSVSWDADSVAENIAHAAIPLAIVCPAFVYVDISPNLRYAFSHEVSWATFRHLYKSYADSLLRLTYEY